METLMSNISAAGGLRLYKGKQDQHLETCVALAGDSVRLGVGDAVVRSAAGATNVGSGPTVQAVARAAAGNPIYGVVAGVVPVIEGTGAMNLSVRYRPASTAQYVLVRPSDPQDVYSVTDDGAAALTKANIGNNANLAVADCSTATGLSNMTLGAASVNTTDALQLTIVGVQDDASNDPASTGARWLVTINNSCRSSGGDGVVGV